MSRGQNQLKKERRDFSESLASRLGRMDRNTAHIDSAPAAKTHVGTSFVPEPE
jgi:hypothetical protein